MENGLSILGLDAGSFGLGLGLGFLVLLVWSFIWKGWALWISARKGSKVWFVALLVLNTMGILEILYIFLFSKESKGINGSASADKKSEEKEAEVVGDSSTDSSNTENKTQ